MQLQMQSQRYDRQQQHQHQQHQHHHHHHHQRTERSPERTPSLNPDYGFEFTTDIQARYQPSHSQHQCQFQTPSQNQHQQHRPRDRNDMSMAGACRMLANAGSTNSTTTKDPFRGRDDGRQLHSPPSSPRLLPTTSTLAASTCTSTAQSANTTPPRTTAPRSGRTEHRLTLPISGRLLRSDWVNLEGLIRCASACLGKEECTGISELGTFHFFSSPFLPLSLQHLICFGWKFPPVLSYPITLSVRSGVYLIVLYSCWRNSSTVTITGCADGKGVGGVSCVGGLAGGCTQKVGKCFGHWLAAIGVRNKVLVYLTSCRPSPHPPSFHSLLVPLALLQLHINRRGEGEQLHLRLCKAYSRVLWGARARA